MVNEDSRWSLTKKGVTLCVTTIRSSMTRNCYILLPMAIGGGWNLIGFSLNHYNRKGENPLSLWMLIWRNCPQPRRTVCGSTKSHEEHRVLNASIRIALRRPALSWLKTYMGRWWFTVLLCTIPVCLCSMRFVMVATLHLLLKEFRRHARWQVLHCVAHLFASHVDANDRVYKPGRYSCKRHRTLTIDKWSIKTTKCPAISYFW